MRILFLSLPVLAAGSKFSWAAYLGVYSLGIVKFIAAVALAYPSLNFWEIIITTAAGGISGIVLFTFFGTPIRQWVSQRYKRKRKLSFARRRKIVQIWRRYGLIGIAVLTPFLSPPVAVAIGLAFNTSPRRLILYCSLSLIAWAFLFAAFRQGVAGWLGWQLA